MYVHMHYYSKDFNLCKIWMASASTYMTTCHHNPQDQTERNIKFENSKVVTKDEEITEVKICETYLLRPKFLIFIK
jgi:hypothetical protein